VLLPSLALLGLWIENVFFPHWHDTCLRWIVNGLEWWGSESAQGLPIDVLGRLLETLFGDSFLLLLIGVPIMFIGGLALGFLWIIPYLLISLLLSLLWLGVTLHILPTMLIFVLAYWLILQWASSPVGPCAWALRVSQAEVERNPTCTLPSPDPLHPGLQIMTTDHPLRYRIDPVTRTGFVMGERFVVCSGADRHAYKVNTCERLQYRCLFDGTALGATDSSN
jgi:hypothetical protein